MVKKVYVLMGPPGSGKGTQAVRLSAFWKIPHIATGDILREHKRAKTKLGLEAQEYMDRGQFVPSELVNKMLLERVEKEDCFKGYLLDGYPRTVGQAEVLKENEQEAELIVLCLDVSDEVIVERITGRLSCPQCGQVYHRKFAPPKRASVCNQCKKVLIRRNDDQKEVVLERLRIYHEQTAPLIVYYESKGLLSHIDGEQDPESVFTVLSAYDS